jgi:nucleotide-binding universal stress UspA family protein
LSAAIATTRCSCCARARGINLGDLGDLGDEARKAADAYLAEAAEQLRSNGLEVETHAMRREPADALIEVAESTDANLIVVGSKGMHGGRRFLLGSVPNRVSHRPAR